MHDFILLIVLSLVVMFFVAIFGAFRGAVKDVENLGGKKND